MRYTVILFFLIVFATQMKAQIKFSLASDVSVMHNFDKQQAFTSFGQTIQGLWHLDEKNTFYSSFSYHTNGKYNNALSASAKSGNTIPQSFTFKNHSEMKIRQISVGIIKYLTGSFKKLEKFNLYGSAGFGLMMGNASNTFSLKVDTLLYNVQNKIINGAGNFKRLSFDLSGGWELPISYEIFWYAEARLQIPTTGYPSDYLLKNNNAPFLGSVNLGIRVLFNTEQ